jgi:capsid protein
MLAYKAMMTIKRAVADRFASTVYRLWYEEMLNRGAFTTVRRNMPSFYEGFNAEWYCSIDWVGASRGQVDELKETQAAILRLNNGLSTLEDENARLGKNWRKQLKQLRQEQDWKKFYDVLQEPTDTTNQTNAASGTKREASDGAMIPSAGTAEKLFLDCEHDDSAEAVNE